MYLQRMQFSVTTYVIVFFLSFVGPQTLILAPAIALRAFREAKELHHHFELAVEHVDAAMDPVPADLSGDEERSDFRFHYNFRKERGWIRARQVERKRIVRLESERRRIDDDIVAGRIGCSKSDLTIRKCCAYAGNKVDGLGFSPIVDGQLSDAAASQRKGERRAGTARAGHVDALPFEFVAGFFQ